jgi:hypothetical protein
VERCGFAILWLLDERSARARQTSVRAKNLSRS